MIAKLKEYENTQRKLKDTRDIVDTIEEYKDETPNVRVGIVKEIENTHAAELVVLEVNEESVVVPDTQLVEEKIKATRSVGKPPSGKNTVEEDFKRCISKSAQKSKPKEKEECRENQRVKI